MTQAEDVMTYSRHVRPGEMFLYNGALWQRLDPREQAMEIRPSESSWLWFRLLAVCDVRSGWGKPDHSYPHYMRGYEIGELISMAIPYDGGPS